MQELEPLFNTHNNFLIAVNDGGPPPIFLFVLSLYIMVSP